MANKPRGAMKLLGEQLADMSGNNQKNEVPEGENFELLEGSLALLDPELVTPWKYANRPEGEFDVDEMVESIEREGQRVPVLVRPIPDTDRYELIYGRRRYEGCKKAGKRIIAIVRRMNDSEAYITQHAENMKRKKLSAYATAKDYKFALDNKLFANPSALARACGIDKTTMSEYLCFFKFPREIEAALPHKDKIGLNTAKYLARNSDNPKLIEVVQARGKAIAEGELNDKALAKLVGEPAEKKRELGAPNYSGVGKGGKLFEIKKGKVSLTKYALKISSEEEISKALETFLKSKE